MATVTVVTIINADGDLADVLVFDTLETANAFVTLLEGADKDRWLDADPSEVKVNTMADDPVPAISGVLALGDDVIAGTDLTGEIATLRQAAEAAGFGKGVDREEDIDAAYRRAMLRSRGR